MTSPQSIETLIEESSALLRQGIELVNTRRDLTAALACFDRATELRRRLPLEAHPEHAYDLAACYLNRGEALQQLGAAGDRVAAIDAFSNGVSLLAPLAAHSEPRYGRRLAVALHNRGRAQAESGNALEAVRDLEQAIALQAPLERDVEDAATIALHARHVLCGVYAAFLAQGQDEGMAIATTATDVAEDALAVFAEWERRGVSRFRSLGTDFFAFALAVYARFQPRFADEFIDDWRDPSRTHADFVSDPRVLESIRQRRSPASSVWHFVLERPEAGRP